MLPLISQIFRQMLRTKIFYFYILIAFLLHWFGLELVLRLRTNIPGELNFGPLLSPEHHFFVSIFIQLFCGAFLSGIFGIWVVPYLHQGPRARLTATLPIARWKFPIVYAFTLLVLLLLLDVGAYAIFRAVSGSLPQARIEPPLAPIAGISSNHLLCLLLEIVSFEVLMFAFALGSLTIGQMPTFILGTLMIGMLQAVSIVIHLMGLEGLAVDYQPELWIRLYHWLPPVGELALDLWKQYKNPEWATSHLGSWALWFVAFTALFWLRLSRPAPNRG